MTRPLLPENLVLRDGILWALRDGQPRTIGEMAELIGKAPWSHYRQLANCEERGWPMREESPTMYPGLLSAQVQALCNRGDLERVKVGDFTVSYRRVNLDIELEAAFDGVMAALR